MLSFLMILFFVLIVMIFVVAAINNSRGDYVYFDNDEEETTSTTTTTTTHVHDDYYAQRHDGFLIKGNLKREVETTTMQSYVIDPVDKDKVYLNSSDDMYEDGAGNIWRLV